MVEFWKCNNGFKQVSEWEADCWIRVTNPTPEELEALEKDYDAPTDFIQDAEDVEERPRIDSESGWLMSLLRVPNKEVDSDGDVSYNTIPLAILVHNEIFITVCFYKAEMLEDFIRWTNRKRLEDRLRYDLMLSIFLSSSVWYLKYLKQMNVMMKAAQEQLEEKMDNEKLQQMMGIERYLVYFTTSLRGNEVVMARLKKHLRHLPYDEDLLDDVEVELQQAYSTANIYSDILERQRESYSSIISNNLNDIMKQLTVITIILMILTGVSSFFGMNVPNGLETWKWAFPCIFLVSSLIAIVAYVIFKKRNLF